MRMGACMLACEIVPNIEPDPNRFMHRLIYLLIGTCTCSFVDTSLLVWRACDVVDLTVHLAPQPNQTRYCPKYEVSFFLEKPALAGMITTFAPLLFVALLSILNVMNADGEGAYETLSRRLLFNPINLRGASTTAIITGVIGAPHQCTSAPVSLLGQQYATSFKVCWQMCAIMTS